MAAVQYPVPAIGQRATSDFIAAMIHKYSLKAADEDRSSTTLANDTALQTDTLDTNASYEVDFFCNFSGLFTTGFKTLWTFPTGATGNKACLGPNGASSGSASTSDMINTYVGMGNTITYADARNSVGAAQMIWEHGVITTSSTAGQIILQWAPNAAATARVHANSYARWRRVA